MASPRIADPFAPLAPLLAAIRRAPLPALFFVTGDDDWIVAEAVRRLVAGFGEAFPGGEVAEHEGTAEGVKEAVADAATVALFASNRLVLLEGTQVLGSRKPTADEVESLPTGEAGEAPAAPLVDYALRSGAGDNALLVHAVSPDAEHGATAALRRGGRTADFSAGDEKGRAERLVALGVERAIERGALVESEVFDLLTERGRLSAREFLSDLDRLIDGAAGPRVAAEDAARLVDDRRKEYGSDFVEAVAGRRWLDALRILERLLSGGDFTAFRPAPGREDGTPPRKGPRGEAAFFPILGLLAADLRRMLALKASAADRGIDSGSGRRLDYRTFADRLLPALKAPRAGVPPLAADSHPFMLFRSFQAGGAWTLEELSGALRALADVDRAGKSGGGTGLELMESWLLSLVPR